MIQNETAIMMTCDEQHQRIAFVGTICPLCLALSRGDCLGANLRDAQIEITALRNELATIHNAAEKVAEKRAAHEIADAILHRHTEENNARNR